jgi:biopolymer transport protein ExbB/TolQ
MIRILVIVGSLLAGILFVALLNAVLPADSIAARLLVDKGMQTTTLGEEIPITRPFSVQTFLWLAFFAGIGEVLLRLWSSQRERAELDKKYLPENPEVLLSSKDLVPVYQRLQQSDRSLFLPRLIERIILQFQATKSVDRANALLASSLDLHMHEIDLRYNFLRYTSWLIPSLGCLGTGIAVAACLDVAPKQYLANSGDINLAVVTQALGADFYTTWLALLMATVLIFLIHVAQEIEEGALNKSGQYCLDHLINKLYEK